MKYLWLLAFIAITKTPLGLERVYKNVVSWRITEFSIELTLDNGKKVLVPALFTVVEEK